MSKFFKYSNPEAAALYSQIKATTEAQAMINDRLKKLNGQLEALKKQADVDARGKKATLTISDIAWTKMVMLCHDCDKEIAWHFTAERRENDEYFVEDILPAYPQKVTGADVVVDDSKFAFWVNDVPDEVWNKVRGQGHSHVNMSTFASATDSQHQKETLQNLTDFYIFIIFNKRDEHWCLIADAQKNVVYENSDITVEIEYSDGDIYDFLVKSREALEKPVTTYAGRSNMYTGGWNNASKGASKGTQGSVYDTKGNLVDQKFDGSKGGYKPKKWWEDFDSDEEFYNYYSQGGFDA